MTIDPPIAEDEQAVVLRLQAPEATFSVDDDGKTISFVNPAPTLAILFVLVVKRAAMKAACIPWRQVIAEVQTAFQAARADPAVRDQLVGRVLQFATNKVGQVLQQAFAEAAKRRAAKPV